LILEDGKSKVDGILYPSVSFSYQEMNLALHPRALNKLQFISAMNVWTVLHGGSTGEIRFLPLEQNARVGKNEQLNWNQFNWVDDNPPKDGKYLKPEIKPHGPGFLTIEVNFQKERILEILNDLSIDIKKESGFPIEITLTEQPETILELYSGVKYETGTLTKYVISENDNNIVFLTPWGFLINFEEKIMFSIGSKVHTFHNTKGISIGFIHAPYNSEKYYLYK